MIARFGLVRARLGIVRVGILASAAGVLAMPNAHAASGTVAAQVSATQVPASQALQLSDPQTVQKLSQALGSGQIVFKSSEAKPFREDVSANQLLSAGLQTGPSASKAFMSSNAQSLHTALSATNLAESQNAQGAGKAFAAQADSDGGDGLEAIASAAKPDAAAPPALKSLSLAPQSNANLLLQPSR